MRLPIFLSLILVGAASIGLLASHRTANSSNTEKLETDRPDQALRWKHLAWRDEFGRIPADGFRVARQQIKDLAAQTARPMGGGGPVWSENGPLNVAGRSRCLVIHPTQTNRMWMGTAGGGIWYSSDSGAHWSPVNDQLPTLSIEAIAFDPANPDIMYAGTGEGYYNVDAIDGVGILKSTDGGATWSAMASTASFYNVTRIAISPSNSNIILAAVSAPYDYSHPSIANPGIYRSTDGGSTWTKVVAVNASYLFTAGLSVAFSPTDGNHAVATCNDVNASITDYIGKAFYTSDGGATWTQCASFTQNGFYGRIELGYAKSSPGTVYAFQARSSGNSWYWTVWRSTDWGATYTVRSNTTISDGQPWYNNCVWVDPTNSNNVVFGGVYLYRTTDGGATVNKISNGYILTDQPHPDVHSIVAKPGFDGSTNKTVYVTTDGGAFYTNDIYNASTSAGWTRLSNDARSTQFYAGVGDATSGYIIGGTQDNGTLGVTASSNNAGLLVGGDGGFVAIDPGDNNYQYGENPGMYLFRTTNKWGSAAYIYSGISDVANGYPNFIAPFILDPTNPSTMLAGGASLWRSTNVKAANPTWSSIKGSHNDSQGNIVPVSAVAVAPSNNAVVWVGYNDGQVFKTTNGTAGSPTWTQVDNLGATPIPNRYVGRILIDPANANVVYVGIGGFKSDNLWKTTDGGSNWTKITGSGATALPSAPIHAIVRDAGDANTLWVGTEVGVCVTHDGGSTWSASTAGPLNVSVYELNWMGHSSKLLAATHGRGMWIYGTPTVMSLTAPSSVDAGATFQGTITLDMPAPPSGLVVGLSSDSTAVTVPTTATIPAGKWNGTFNATAGSPSVDTNVTLTASYGGSSAQAVVTVKAGSGTVVPASVTVKPTSTYGGSTATVTGTVTLTAAAPTGGVSVALSSSNSAVASVPATLSIAAGSTTGTFAVTTTSVSSAKTITLTATLNSVSQTCTLKVMPPKLKLVTVKPTSVDGGSTKTVTGKVTLNAPAPTGGMTVSLASSNSAVAAPAVTSVLVPAGSSTATFGITHTSVNAPTSVTISGTLKTVTKSATLTVNPPALVGFKLNMSTVVGSSTTTVYGTVTLDAPAASSGRVVSLSSSDPTAASVPATVTVAAGKKTKTFVVQHYTVTGNKTVTLTATLDAVVKQATLTVTP